MHKIKTIYSFINSSKYSEIKNEYKYQEELTKKLDLIDSEFNQDIINEIVLWKVNRYVNLNNETLVLLNQIKKSDTEINVDLTKTILRKLLETKGVRIALASTILRFKNSNIYQIIDQRVYRFIHPNGEELKNSNKIEDTIDMYLEYLERLHFVCKTYKINFTDSDRILYLMDKKSNEEFKLRY